MKRLWNIVVWAVVAVVVVGGGVALFSGGSSDDSTRTIEIERREVRQDVAFTGRLQAKQTAALGFETAGTVTQMLVEVGDKVTVGQQIAYLDSQVAELELASAIASQRSSAEQKKIAWDTAAETYENTKAEYEATLETKRQAVRDAKRELDQQRQVHQETIQESGTDSSTGQAAVLALRKAESVYHATQEALTTTIETAEKTNAANFQAAELAESQYLATVQTSGGIAGLSTLDAAESIAQVRLSKQVMTSPMDGVVTKVEVEEGEVALAAGMVVEVQTVQDIELAAEVPETDASKLANDMSATVTFDALPQSDQWSARIVHVDPAARVFEGVPTYEVRLRLDDPGDSRFRPGLTANITVHADQRSNVIAVPRRSVIRQEGRQFVEVQQSDGTLEERDVVTGLLGSDGYIEITSGLSEGEVVVISRDRDVE